jgi:hypothetical protein
MFRPTLGHHQVVSYSLRILYIPGPRTHYKQRALHINHKKIPRLIRIEAIIINTPEKCKTQNIDLVLRDTTGSVYT